MVGGKRLGCRGPATRAHPGICDSISEVLTQGENDIKVPRLLPTYHLGTQDSRYVRMKQGGLEIVWSRRLRKMVVVDGHKRSHVVGSNGAGSFFSELMTNSDMFRFQGWSQAGPDLVVGERLPNRATRHVRSTSKSASFLIRQLSTMSKTTNGMTSRRVISNVASQILAQGRRRWCGSRASICHPPFAHVLVLVYQLV